MAENWKWVLRKCSCGTVTRRGGNWVEWMRQTKSTSERTDEFTVEIRTVTATIRNKSARVLSALWDTIATYSAQLRPAAMLGIMFRERHSCNYREDWQAYAPTIIHSEAHSIRNSVGTPRVLQLRGWGETKQRSQCVPPCCGRTWD
jgi:hypothetical protein